MSASATEPPKRQSAGRDTRSRYRALLDSIDAGFAVIELMFDADDRPVDWRYLEVNAGFERQTGLQGVTGRRAREVIAHLEQHWLDVFGRVAREGVNVRFENVAAGLGNRWYEVQAFRLPDAASGTLGFFFNDITARKLADDALRHSEAKFRGLVQAIPDDVWTALPDGRLDWSNLHDGDSDLDAGARRGLEGLPDADAWLRVLHPDDRRAAREAWSRALAIGEPYQSEFRVRHGAGAYRWHIARAVAVRDAAGVIVRWVGTNTDIDEQKGNAQALARLNRTLEEQVAERTADRNRLWQLSTDVMLVCGLDGTILSANPALPALLGWLGHDLLGKQTFDLIHPDDLGPARAGLEALVAGASVQRLDLRMRHKHDGYRWISWAGSSDGERITAVGRDVTAENERSEALARSEARLRSIFAASYQSQGLMDLDGTLLDANPASLDVIGARLEDVVGQPIWETPWFRETSDVAQLVRDAVPRVGSGAIVRTEIVVDVPTGRRAFDFSMRPIRGSDNAVSTLLFEAMELTDRRAAEEMLRQSQKLQAVGQLTGGIAHDFNNILQVISGNLQLVSRLAGNAKADERIGLAQSAVQRGAKLASQLLAFSRRQPLQPKVVNVGRLIGAMEDMLRQAIGDGVEIDISVAEGLWNVLADPGQIENAVLNLAINARDAMQGNGKLHVGIGNVWLDELHADAGASADINTNTNSEAGARAEPEAVAGARPYVVLAVGDTGCGMSAELVERAFEPFFSTKPPGAGTGLGLSMVYGFASQSGGHARIHSQPNHGTTVTLYLPRVQEPEDTHAPLDGEPVDGGHETVLVVEDDAEVRSTVVALMKELGYRVLQAADPTHALAVLESGAAIDLLFTDVVMPGPLASAELARKARERMPDIAVLFTSGYMQNALGHGGKLEPGFELLSKPYTQDALARKIRLMLRRRPQRSGRPV